MPITYNQLIGKTAYDLSLTATGGGAQTCDNPCGVVPIAVLACQTAGTGTTLVYNPSSSTTAELNFTSGGAGTWVLIPLIGQGD